MTYILEYHRDDRNRGEAKGVIYLDSCVEVVKAPRRAKLAFDLTMQDKSRYSLAAETEAEADHWIAILRKVVAAQEQGWFDLNHGLIC